MENLDKKPFIKNEKIASTMRTYTRKEPEIIQGVEELCRLCLETREDGVNIFEKALIPSIATKIMMCVGLEMEERDCLPNMICKSCEKELESIYSFRKKCEVNYMKLKSHLRAVLKSRKSFQINNNLVENVHEQTENRKEETQENPEVDAQEYIVYLDMNSDNVKDIEKVCCFNVEKLEIANNGNSNDSFTNITIVNENQSKNVQNEIVNNENHEMLNEIVENDQEKLVMKTDILNNEKNDNEEIIVISKINKNSNDINRANVDVNSDHRPMEISLESQLSNTEEAMETDGANHVVTDGGNGIITIQFQSNTQETTLKTNTQNTTQNTTTGDTEDLPSILLTQLVNNGLIEMDGDCVSLVDPGAVWQLLTGDGALLTFNLTEEESEEFLEPEESDSDKLVMATESATVKGAITKIHDTPLTVSNGVLNTVPRCDTCSKTFASSSVLKRHMLVHSSVLPHTCHICGRGFKQRAVMTRHLLVHNDERPHKCPTCPASFTQLGALAAHCRSHAPPGAKPLQLYRCQACHKTFLHQSGLIRHMKTHLGKSYTCGDCSRTFRDQSSLRRHARRLHPPTVSPT